MLILLAEDYDDTREGLTLALTHAGWEVIAAKDGREALLFYHQVIETGRYFDLLLLDVVMPRLGGIGVGIIVRRLELMSDVPRSVHVYLTGYDDLVEPLDHTFVDAYITKPVGPNELIKKIKELVKK